MLSSTWVALALTIPVLAVAPTTGVSPHKAALYVPIAGSSPPTWKCLNDSRVIPWQSVNDDFCDCPDGSDEPGTSACADSSFWCVNKGHMGQMIPGSRVGDGLCEPECCDGSDEAPGVCPDRCKAIGEEHRAKHEALRKIRKTGAKIRGTYIAFAQKEKKRVEESIAALEKEVVVKEQEAERLNDILARTETISHAAMEHRKSSPLYQQLLVHSRALKSLQRYHKDLQEKERTLSSILETLKGGYNPNYQDMAVLEAVRGWDAYSAPPEVPQVGAIDEPAEEEVGMWSAGQIEHQLDGLLEQDYESLLVQHDEHIANMEEEGDETRKSYIPEALSARYEIARDIAASWLTKLGIVRGSAANPTEETNRARTVAQAAESAASDARDAVANERSALGKLFDPSWFGAEGEWRKLENVCLSKDTGEYTYEVCMFGSATQKSNNGGSRNHLGSFEHWHGEVGSREFYTQQHYTHGARCWNGPERSVTLHLECGTDNVILSVSEPEKCEYHLTGTTPALCLPLDANDEAGHPEL